MTKACRVLLHAQGGLSEADLLAYTDGRRVQLCRTSVTASAGTHEIDLHLAVVAHGPHAVEALEPRAGRIAVLIAPRDASPCRAWVDAAQQHLTEEIAAAAAVMEAAWGWDERTVIPIEVNGVGMVAQPTYLEGGRWDVVVRTGNATALPEETGPPPAIPARGPAHLTARQAVLRGTLLISVPSVLLFVAGGAMGAYSPSYSILTGAIVGYAVAWLYWSAAIPRWRDWVLRIGLQPDDVQALAQERGLLWSRGSVFERTELPRSNGRQGW